MEERSVMNRKYAACCFALGSVLAIAGPLMAVQDQTAHPAVRHETHPKSQNTTDEGQRVFDQNCARCHNAPDGFSPRITGTIVRHMRVRANLSQHDEQVLLHFFNQ
jgi:mono/diheme cytochrome c family protein